MTELFSLIVICLWKEMLSQQRIRHVKILHNIHFAYDVGIISSCSNIIFLLIIFKDRYLLIIFDSHKQAKQGTSHARIK